MTFQRRTARRIIGLIRALKPDTHIVVGGYDPTLAPEAWMDPELGVTALVQSSSATALIASSFVSQNLMGLAPALAIMLGADVGTSLVVQLFSFDLSWLSPLAIGGGVILHLSRKATRAGQIGTEVWIQPDSDIRSPGK